MRRGPCRFLSMATTSLIASLARGLTRKIVVRIQTAWLLFLLSTRSCILGGPMRLFAWSAPPLSRGTSLQHYRFSRQRYAHDTQLRDARGDVPHRTCRPCCHARRQVIFIVAENDEMANCSKSLQKSPTWASRRCSWTKSPALTHREEECRRWASTAM